MRTRRSDGSHETGRTTIVKVRALPVSAEGRLDVEPVGRITVIPVNGYTPFCDKRLEDVEKGRAGRRARAVVQCVFRAGSLQMPQHCHHRRNGAPTPEAQMSAGRWPSSDSVARARTGQRAVGVDTLVDRLRAAAPARFTRHSEEIMGPVFRIA